MALIEIQDLARGPLSCSYCGQALALQSLYIQNHRDPPRSCIEFLPVTAQSGEAGIELSVILDGKEADERGVVGTGVDEDGVEEEVYGDYSAGLAAEDRDTQGVMFVMQCRKCVNEPAFHVRFEPDRGTRFYWQV